MSFPLSAQRIAAFLTQAGPPAAQQVAIEVVAETGSTNADLLARLPQLQGPLLRVAEKQTAGRGRAGRTWHSEPGAVLTFSLAWPFPLPRHALTGLPLATGVAVAEVLSEYGLSVGLKWPNDLVKDERKLGGILIETARAVSPQENWAVIGIGLNLRQPAGAASHIGQPVASLDLPELDTDRLLAQIATGLADAAVQFAVQGLPAFAERWNRRHVHAGRTVRILEGERVLHKGRAIGLGDNGALLLETASGTVSVMSGDVSLRVSARREEEGEHVIAG